MPNSGVILAAFSQDDLRDLAAAGRHLRHGLRRADAGQLLGDLELAVRRADQLDQVEGRHRVARLAVHDVVQPALRAALVVHGLEVAQRVRDAPARVGVHPDVLLVLGRDLVGVAVELQPALVEAVHVLDEGHLEVQPGRRDQAPDRPAELGEDRLLGLRQRVEGPQRQEERDQGRGDDDGPLELHGCASFALPSSERSGSTPRAFSSTTTLRFSLGSTWASVSR